MLSIKELSISLFPPAHPIVVFPFLNFLPWSDSLSKVTFNEGFEVINTKSVNEVLHTGVGTDVTVTMITLSSKNTLHNLHDVFLGNKSKVISSSCKCAFLVVRATHTTSNHDVETLKFTGLIIGNNDNTDIIGVKIKGVISRHSNTNLELTRQVTITIDWFSGVGQNDTTPRVVQHCVINIVVLNFLCPSFNSGSLFTIQPDLGECGSHRAE
mmetsp:Transcript_16858/g.22145  ORF Transcript_16858/g.22145 Transcript_16858/m.22145 type:complete len:212 (-) Transcript_16858:89-724(-)